MHGKERVVKLRIDEWKSDRVADIPVRHDLGGRKSQLPTQEKRQRPTQQKKCQRGEEVLNSNNFMIQRPQILFPSRGLFVTVTMGLTDVGCSDCAHISLSSYFLTRDTGTGFDFSTLAVGAGALLLAQS